MTSSSLSFDTVTKCCVRFMREARRLPWSVVVKGFGTLSGQQRSDNNMAGELQGFLQEDALSGCSQAAETTSTQHCMTGCLQGHANCPRTKMPTEVRPDVDSIHRIPTKGVMHFYFDSFVLGFKVLVVNRSPPQNPNPNTIVPFLSSPGVTINL